MEAIDILPQLVKINSVFPNEKAISTFISQYLSSRGYWIQTILTDENRPNIIATTPHISGSYIGFYGHMDTVPPASDYSRDPFTVFFDEKNAYGLGAGDMKGGLSCMLSAASFAIEKNLPACFIFGVDEENISQGAHDLVSSGLLKDLRFLVVAESGQIKNYEQPLSACYGRKGRIVVEVTIEGKKAHAAESHKGVNAIEEAARFISQLKSFSFPTHSMLGKTDIIVQQVHSNTDSFSVPDVCTLTISLLTTPNVSSVDFIRTAQNWAEKEGVKITIAPKERSTPYGEAYEIDRKNSFLKRIEETILTPLEIDPIYTGSVADENVFANRLGIPVLTLGPIGGGDHTAGEWVRVESLSCLTEAYKKMLVLGSE